MASLHVNRPNGEPVWRCCDGYRKGFFLITLDSAASECEWRCANHSGHFADSGGILLAKETDAREIRIEHHVARVDFPREHNYEIHTEISDLAGDVGPNAQSNADEEDDCERGDRDAKNAQHGTLPMLVQASRG